MKQFTLSVADCREFAQNKNYPHEHVITDSATLACAVMFDHVAGTLRGHVRSKETFITADCVIMDCDNGHSDNKEDWFKPEDLQMIFRNVGYYVVYSRNNQKVKEGKSARPRFHVYFPLSCELNGEAIRRLKEDIIAASGDMFDEGAKDAARLIFGVAMPRTRAFGGELTIDTFLAHGQVEASAGISRHQQASAGISRHQQASAGISRHQQASAGEIPQGTRHNTLLRLAFKALHAHSEEQARRIFEAACSRCKPSFPTDEAAKIWEYAVSHLDDEPPSRRGSKTVTLAMIEAMFEEQGISVRFNVITRQVEVSGIPTDSELVPASFGRLSPARQRIVAESLLPSFIYTYFKTRGYSISSIFAQESINTLATMHSRNPVREMIESREWDGIDRVGELIHNVLHIPQIEEGFCSGAKKPAPLTKAVRSRSSLTTTATPEATFVRKWLHQAITLGLNDEGEYAGQFMLVLQGKQGIGKTELFRRLAMSRDLFAEGLSIDMNNKDSLMQSVSVWIGEIGELDSTLKREQAALKSFITSRTDTYRKPYARRAEQVERHTCFCGTVNPEQVLRDETGNRRFVILHVDDIDIDFVLSVMNREYVQQLWRQVYETMYLPHPDAYYLTRDEQAYLNNTNQAHTIPVECEVELLEGFDWTSDIDTWTYRPLSYVKSKLDLRQDMRKISRAITSILSKRTDIDAPMKRLVHGHTEYLLPQTAIDD